MNGIVLDNYQEARNYKKKVKTNQFHKMVACVLVSNLLTFVIFSPPFFLEDQADNLTKSDMVEYEGFVKMNLPLKLYVPIEVGKEVVPVSIYSSNRKLIIQHALVHPSVQKNRSSDSFANFESFTEAKRYLVEIPRREVSHFVKQKGEVFLAYPPNMKESVIAQKKERGIFYEIIF